MGVADVMITGCLGQIHWSDSHLHHAFKQPPISRTEKTFVEAVVRA